MRKERSELASSLWLGAALACFVFTVLAAAAGSLLTTSRLLNGQLHPRLHGLGLILLILAFPTLILAGHCLDLRDRHETRHAKKTHQYFIRVLGIVFSVLLELGYNIN